MADAEHLSNGITHGHHGPPLFSNQRSDSVQAVQKGATSRLTNGDHPFVKPEPAVETAMVNGARSPPPALNLPPELLANIAASYTPFSILIERIGQECFNDLNEVIGRMADLQVQPAVNGVNGASAVNMSGNPAIISAEKKRLILDFANRHREKFIKLLVISKWSRKIDDVQQLVHLKSWLESRLWEFGDSSQLLGQLKLDLHFFKQPNPDIRTALEALSSGTASSIPDLGYVPAKPLTPQQMLETLRNVDALLSIRINLHEELPRQLKQWDVANGRATFRLPGEFEFDVTVVDEDPSARFYFLDMRFLFSPAAEIPAGQLRQALEDRSNELLGTSGLSSCYEFLHDFTLTHKINALRKQAHQMSRGVWYNSLRIETVKRSLIVRYWPDSKSGKSWIEIGVASGKPKDGKVSWRGKPPPRLSLRWFRNGAEVTDIDATFDWADLSMERILKQIIARHEAIIINSIKSGLPAAPGGNGLHVLQANVSDAEPADCSLKMQVNGQRTPAVLMVEPIAGRIVLQPPSPLATRAEMDINNQQHRDKQLSATVARYLAREMQDHTEHQAEQCGWRTLKNLRIERAVAAFGQETITMSFFRCPGWGLSPWAVAATVNLSGESWWIVEFADPSFGESIQSIQPLEPLLHRRGQEPNSLEPLRRIEALAIASISIAAASRQLKTLRVSHSHEREQHFIPGIDIVASPSSNQTNFTLLINTSALIRKAGPKAASFALNILRLEVHGYSRRHNTVTYHVHGQLRPSAKQSPETFTGVQDKDVMIKRNGRFGLKLTVPFGQSCTEALTNRLLSLHRARSCATALQKNNINLNSINLSRITFTYSATTISSTNSSGPTNLNAEISFSDIPNAKNPISIIFPPLNPHRRIQALLTRILNYRGGEARSDLPFGFFVAFLRISLPLVRALDIIEDKDLSADTKQQSSTGLNFHARSCDWYRIEYKQKGVTLDVKLKRIRDELVWFIDEAPLPPIKSQGQQQQEQPQKSPALVDAMEKVLGSRGKGWRGLHSCIKANADGGVEDALLRLDEVIRSEGVAENGTTNSATTAVTAAPTGGAAKANQSAASGAAQIKQQPQQQRQEVITLD